MDKEEIAKLLISLKCLQVSPSRPFTYASGLKGPLYCDNRQILSHAVERSKIADAFCEEIKKSGLEFDSIAGLATAGIPHAALVADRLKVPMIYVRSKPKGHGKGNQVEGAYKKGDRILLIEDLVNQGSSLAEAVEGLLAQELKPLACFCIVDYEMPAAQKVSRRFDLPIYALTDFSSIAAIAQKSGLISVNEYDLLQKWHKDPGSWQA